MAVIHCSDEHAIEKNDQHLHWQMPSFQFQRAPYENILHPHQVIIMLQPTFNLISITTSDDYLLDGSPQLLKTHPYFVYVAGTILM